MAKSAMKTVVACDVFLGQDHLMRSGSINLESDYAKGRSWPNTGSIH